MPTLSQLQELQGKVDRVLNDQNVSPAETRQIFDEAVALGVSPKRLSLMTRGVVPESDVRAAIQSIDPNAGILGFAEGEVEAYSDNPTLNTVAGQNPGSLSNPGIANSPQNPNPTQPQTNLPVPTQQPTAQPTQGPANGFTLPPLENLGNTFAGLFGNNPGALGFSDLNPSVTSAESTVQAAIPEALKPFLAQSIDASQGSMAGLTQLLARDNALTSPFNSLQNQAQQQAVDIANGAGGFIPQAQSVFQEIADGSDIVGLFDRAQGLLEAPAGLDSLSNFTSTSAMNPTATNQLTSLATNPAFNTTAQNTLERTAQGDFLYGSPAFNEAVQASIRAARPQILSNFSLQGGNGAATSGLAQTAMQQAASDSFAGLFSQERNRQLGAANQLNSNSLAGNNLRMNAANSLNNFSLDNRGLQQNAANSTVSALQNAGSIFSNIANADRGRQMTAASQLPQIGLMGADILSSIGGQRQQQEERTKMGQVQAMQNLLGSSFGNVNPNSMFGNINSVQQTGNSLLGGLGGALAGSELGGLLPESFKLMGMGGPALGAIGGGILGLL